MGWVVATRTLKEGPIRFVPVLRWKFSSNDGEYSFFDALKTARLTNQVHSKDENSHTRSFVRPRSRILGTYFLK
ncbi:hypothetical protein A2872_04420 [Candidatus Gottesmanbacteria bacterium RIFCSPHIGHO2_01_FULL_42_12]|uniref:Uncharacterized protein n=1 Tax=Candidatus Gottesmanbacteria bacterium RIFCSPHIGHO2_01_FULL_42_12 TaxID=1798377 RepID=A0A1F5Z1E5_9BACT|nr:MAG: hypothetical protein A2872_04420 [Candidatus Gottesmanbacteria bacterium RIFCSPHIGHO2_01_FULL_42_12]